MENWLKKQQILKFSKMTAIEFLISKGKRELENIKVRTNEYVVTPKELDEYAKQKAIEFAEWCASKMERDNWFRPDVRGEKWFLRMKGWTTTADLYKAWKGER
jgi:hypothetical protein